jgi:uncharacterized OB-fold protein
MPWRSTESSCSIRPHWVATSSIRASSPREPSPTIFNRRPTGPPWADAVPQLLAVVQWDAGPRISTELVDVDPGDIRIGMRVSPVFCDVPEAGITLLKYRPA